MLGVAEPFLMQNTHPTVIIKAYRQALEDMVDILKEKIRSVEPMNKLLTLMVGQSLNKHGVDGTRQGRGARLYLWGEVPNVVYSDK